MSTIAGTTKLLGVIGYPIEHTLSPLMHNAAIAHLGVDYVYLPLPIQPTDLEIALRGMAAVGVKGFNVTIPHKQAILSLLAEVSETAQAVGAVNTVWRTERGWAGTNTDVAGFLAPLQAHSQDWSQGCTVILGNGGAARAVVAGCGQHGCREVYVVGRNLDKLKAFQHSWQESPWPLQLHIHPWETLPDLLPHVGLLVNTTPVGMHPQVQASPVSEAAMVRLPRSAIAYDLIYTPNPTRFLQLAQEQGAITINGLEMLVQQGAAALRIWLQQPVPTQVMRQTLCQHLGLSGASGVN